ncbi:MAG: CDP-alcohol phosphatidyltransferase family protein [Acidimicrobiales bacterium]
MVPSTGPVASRLDEERGAVLDGKFRRGVDRCVRPFGAALVRTGISPDVLTATGLLLAVPTALAVATGHLLVGLGLLILSAVPDLLDGALAKASGRVTVRGAFFDSVSDRVADTLVLGGVAWYLQTRHGGHAFLLPVAVLGASLLISYQRAKAESLGFDAKGGLMERAERIVVLCAGLAFRALLVPLLWAMLALTLFTAGQRFVKVWRQASVDVPPSPRRVGGRRPLTSGSAAARAERIWSRTAARSAPSQEAAASGWATPSESRWRERREARLRARGGHADSRWRGTRRP